MPQKLLYQLRVDAPSEKKRGAGVTEIGESYLRQASLLEEWLEGTLHEVLEVDKRTDACREDQPVILTHAFELDPLFELTLTVCLQCTDRTGSQINLPPAPPGLRLPQSVTTTFPHECTPNS
jgi:hypothetical protein